MIKLIVVLVISYISLSDACSCFLPQGWEQQAYCNSQFAGTIKVLGPSYNCGQMNICHSIAVVQQFRGSTISPTVLETASQSAACGVYLTPGNTYFVATNPLNANRIAVYLCGLYQDWTSLTCCDMIKKAKSYDCNNIHIPIETPVDPIFSIE